MLKLTVNAKFAAAGMLMIVTSVALTGCWQRNYYPDFFNCAAGGVPGGSSPSGQYGVFTIDQLAAQGSKGDLSAYRVIGERYLHGIGVTADRDKAIRWFRRAAVRDEVVDYLPRGGKDGKVEMVRTVITPERPGDIPAMFALAELFRIGGDGAEPNPENGAEWGRCAAIASGVPYVPGAYKP